jgi:hypothetical protein
MNEAELRSQYKSGERNFREQDFSNLDLSYFQLAGADFNRSNFSRTNLRVAELAGANFAHCDLTFAELGSADLTDANLKGANLRGANLQGAIVTNIQYDDQTLFPIGFKPPGFTGLNLTPLRTKAPLPQVPQPNVAEDEPATIEIKLPKVPEISEVAASSERSETPELSETPPVPLPPTPPPAANLAPHLPKGGSSSTTQTVIRGTTTGGEADLDPAYGVEDTFIRPDPLPDALSVPVIPIATHIPPAEPPPKPEPPTGVTRPVLPAQKELPRPTFDPVSEAKTVIPVAITPEAARAVVATEPPPSDLPTPEQSKLPRPQGIALPWTTILSIILLCALAVYYAKTEQLKGLEIFWLISVFVICTIPSFASHQNQPSFSNLVSAIGVPVLGIVNGFFYDGSLIRGWWLVFFLAAWFVVLSVQSKTQNNPKFAGDPKFVYLNNALVALGFVLNALVLKFYVPVYQGYLMKFQVNGTMIAFTLENMGQILGLIGHVLGGFIFLLWSAFSFVYVTSIYSLEYDKKWFTKILTVLGLGVLGLLNVYLHPTNFMAGWWLVFVIGFILLVVNASIKVQNSQ